MNVMRLGPTVVVFLILLSAFYPACAQERAYLIAPSVLLHTERAMKTPGFWISRHPSPDLVIMEPDKLAELNARIQNELKLTKDLTQLPAMVSGDELLKSLRSQFEEIKAKGYFAASGEEASLLFFQDIESNLNMTSVPNVIEPQFGFILHYADQRFFPTVEGLYAVSGDLDFDELQNNALEAATPVALLHKSFDGNWYYVQGPASDGWVEAKNIILCASKDIQDYLNNESWAVVVKPKADIFLDEQLTQYYDHAQMGTRFPKEKKQNASGAVAVKIPSRREDGRFVFKTVYLGKEDVNDGFLAYTARTIYKQAFQLLNEPYGWGGMYGEQDCSRFLQQVFATVGINLPRDSKDQAKVGIGVAQFDDKTKNEEKVKLFSKAAGAKSVLTMKGHIMLYLGMVDGRPYAIHAVWAYREPDPNAEDDRVRVMNRVVVSDLNLGEGSKKGSLLKRLTGIRMILR